MFLEKVNWSRQVICRFCIILSQSLSRLLCLMCHRNLRIALWASKGVSESPFTLPDVPQTLYIDG